MIFGKSKEEKKSIKQAHIKNKIFNGISKFAYFPVCLENGKYIWLEFYYSYYIGGKNNDGDYFILYSSGYSSDYSELYRNYTYRDNLHINFQGKPK